MTHRPLRIAGAALALALAAPALAQDTTSETMDAAERAPGDTATREEAPLAPAEPDSADPPAPEEPGAPETTTEPAAPATQTMPTDDSEPPVAPEATPDESWPTLAAELTGGAEVPGPGDSDGSGSAMIQVSAAAGQLCYSLSVGGIATASAAHIHKAAEGQAGPVAIPFEAPSSGSSEACIEVEQLVLTDLLANPAGYYVNVHNGDFPEGAIRGQLAPAPVIE